MKKGLLYVYTVGDGFTYTITLDADIYLVTSPKGNLVFFREDTSIKQVKTELENKFSNPIFIYVGRDIKLNKIK